MKAFLTDSEIVKAEKAEGAQWGSSLETSRGQGFSYDGDDLCWAAVLCEGVTLPFLKA